MKKVKMFLEFVSETEKSKYLDLSYSDILKQLSSKGITTSLDSLEKFEEYLDEQINPGQSFHGSFETEDQAQVPMYDKIENFDQYMDMYKKWTSIETRVGSNSHNEDGL